MTSTTTKTTETFNAENWSGSEITIETKIVEIDAARTLTFKLNGDTFRVALEDKSDEIMGEFWAGPIFHQNLDGSWHETALRVLQLSKFEWIATDDFIQRSGATPSEAAAKLISMTF